ncbi:hypothetical protein [Sandaracinus amylolyticus]|uniref:hypothetical protein n=1 Tax=Sandaracinus amylolyticus TaxID=927083 RepID=UPI001F2FF824|nr:hypothetical protein [Sandaracinus amylolyticus]UJR85731.1 Hypothetical protein I5071_78110 [Sandaracinus amylolyticus]
MRTELLPSFPAFAEHPCSMPLVEHLARARLVEANRAKRALSGLLDVVDARRPIASGRAAVRAFALAAHRLASLERAAGSHAAAERALSDALTRLLGLAIDRHAQPELRLAAANAAESCADDLATLYDDHELAEHAGYARRAIVMAQRAARTAMS